jgi:hypothetical protein
VFDPGVEVHDRQALAGPHREAQGGGAVQRVVAGVDVVDDVDLLDVDAEGCVHQ